MKSWITAALLSLTVIGAAQADPYYNNYNGRFNNRENHQEYRIQQGFRSGQLTPSEARHLERREDRLRYQEQMARRGGLSPMERARLEREQARLNRDIYRQSHDGQVRRGW